MTLHKFGFGQTVWGKNGKRYTILAGIEPRPGDGEPRYYARIDAPLGGLNPKRVMNESAFGEYPDQPAYWERQARDGFEAAYDDAVANERKLTTTTNDQWADEGTRDQAARWRGVTR